MTPDQILAAFYFTGWTGFVVFLIGWCLAGIRAGQRRVALADVTAELAERITERDDALKNLAAMTASHTFLNDECDRQAEAIHVLRKTRDELLDVLASGSNQLRIALAERDHARGELADMTKNHLAALRAIESLRASVDVGIDIASGFAGERDLAKATIFRMTSHPRKQNGVVA